MSNFSAGSFEGIKIESNPSYAISGSAYTDFSDAQSSSISQEVQSYLFDNLLDVFQTHKNPDWDGEGAAPITAQVVSVAMKLISIFPAGIQKPEISAGNEGEVSFDWQKKSGQILTIACFPNGKYFFAAQFSRESRISGAAHISEPLPFTLHALLTAGFS